MDTAVRLQVLELIVRALAEDVGSGDITSEWIIPPDLRLRGDLLVKQVGVIAGLEVAALVFATVDPSIQFTALVNDGDRVNRGTVVARVVGPARSILTAERTALNFLQRMSGIATDTRRFVDAVAGTRAVILDTRKTCPGLRLLDKWAVRLGGAQNHRTGLYDMVLIKDNHIAAAGGITQAVRKVRERIPKGILVEVEVKSLVELDEALALGVDRIMLDNMSLDDIREAVRRAQGRVKLEVSGGVTLSTVTKIAATGVDYISVGALTHSPQALDISLELYPQGA
ncbi:MAG: carboxylating nicotinate-nucleotide diphosphorylase [Anaerolineales bacterium]